MPKYPETKFAPTVDGKVAYQVIGDGGTNLVFVSDWFQNIEVMWEEPRFERFLLELASFTKLIVFDKRGAGVSDPVPSNIRSAGPAIELAVEDIHAVMNDSATKTATIVGVGCGCWPAMLFAATAPARVERLVLIEGFPRFLADQSFPIGLSAEEAHRMADRLIRQHGSGQLLKLIDPQAYKDPQFLKWYARYERLSVCPKVMQTFWESFEQVNLIPVLPSIKVSTLVMNRTESRAWPARWGRYIADHIPNALFEELPGPEQLFYMAHPNLYVEKIRYFITGAEVIPNNDRVLATILFTDIVGSTERLSEQGDKKWRDQMIRHNALVRSLIERFRGREIDNAGDGFFATFDTPARAISCAASIRDAVKQLGIMVRIGIHTGECEVVGDRIAGIAVHIAARIKDRAESGEILISRTVRDLVSGSGLRFADKGEYELKGIPGSWEVFTLAQ